MMKKLTILFLGLFMLASCGGFKDDIAKSDFQKKCPDCKIVEVYSEECQDGSVLSCYLVKINYTQGSDSLKSVMCQYIKGDNGWHLVE
jgi:hypothetical protein